MVLSANEAREIIEKVTNDERNKVFEDIKNCFKLMIFQYQFKPACAFIVTLSFSN